ncbi:hypothetical protein WA026_022242 [Henosepilachna vigintioctopunctata]|uniref:Uncharacterized protein n=1 Tax=Henosepilachna vigintioctopunctata TaxID=420089 RepID=A0AAW1UG96_9CUCU
MEYTICEEGKLQYNLLDDKISKQSNSSGTPADKGDKISSIPSLNEIHQKFSAKRGFSSKKIAITVTEDFTISSKAGANHSYAYSCNI